MTERWKWYWGWLAAALIVLLVIHALYKFAAPCSLLEPEWTAGELLGYSGSIIGAMVAVNALVQTLRSEGQFRRDDRRFEVKPLIVASEQSRLENEGVDKILSHPERNAVFVLIFSSQENLGNELQVDYADIPSGNQCMDIRKSLLSSYQMGSIKCSAMPSGIVLHLKVANVGSGPAINLTFRVEGEKVVARTVEGSVCHSPIKQMLKNGQINVYVWVQDMSVIPKSGLELVAKYDDQDNRAYEQRNTMFRCAEGGK